MNSKRIRNFCDKTFDIAIKHFQKDGTVIPTAFFLTEKEMLFSPLVGLLSEEDVNEFFVSTIKRLKPLCALYIMLKGGFRVDGVIHVQKSKDDHFLLHCEYPDGKFEFLQEYKVAEDGKLILGKRRISDTDFVGIISGYFEDSEKQINWAA